MHLCIIPEKKKKVEGVLGNIQLGQQKLDGNI